MGFPPPQLCADNLKCTTSDDRALLLAARFAGRYIRAVGQEASPEMSVLLSTSRAPRRRMTYWLANAGVVKVLARKFGVGQWSFIGPGSEKKWYSAENSPQGAWDHIADEMLLEFAESGHPIFRATTPLSRGTLKSKGHGKLSIHFTADYPTIETIFRIIISANQLSLYGAVANICEEFENHQDRSGEPEILMGQSLVLAEI